MARKKNNGKKYRDLFASSGEDDTHFGMIYEGMCKHKSFQKLSTSEKIFYVLCRVQSQTAQGKRCLYNHSKFEDYQYPENCFVFPSKHMQEYGIKHQNGSRCLKALCEKGFLNRLENNTYRGRVNVYQFSDKWKE